MSHVGHTGFEQFIYENNQLYKNYETQMNMPACKMAKTKMQMNEAFKQ